MIDGVKRGVGEGSLANVEVSVRAVKNNSREIVLVIQCVAEEHLRGFGRIEIEPADDVFGILWIAAAGIGRRDVIHRAESGRVAWHSLCKCARIIRSRDYLRCAQRASEGTNILPCTLEILLNIRSGKGNQLRCWNKCVQTRSAANANPFRDLREEQLVLDDRAGDNIPKLIARVAPLGNRTVAAVHGSKIIGSIVIRAGCERGHAIELPCRAV